MVGKPAAVRVKIFMALLQGFEELRQMMGFHIGRLFEPLDPRIELGGQVHRQRFIWSDLRWGLRPRWYGDVDSMLALGVTAVKTRRFDTDDPRVFFDVVSDLEAELGLPRGQHIYGREDIWPHMQEMYEGYIAAPSQTAS